jgi:hypothetical protein
MSGMSASVFPTRALQVRPPKSATPFKNILFGIMWLGIAGFIAWWQVPGLLKDYRIRDNAEPAQQARIVKARCRSKIIIHMCETEIQHRVNNETLTTADDFAFFDLKTSSYTTSILQERGNPAVVTTSIAIESLWNRMITSSLFIGGLALAGLWMIVSALRGTKESRRFRELNNAQLTPILVEIFGYKDEDDNKRRWFYGKPGSDPEQAHSALFNISTRPFFLNEDGTRGLAVNRDEKTEPLLLDHALMFLNLKDEERSAIMGWRQSIMERAAAASAAQQQTSPTPA